VTRNEQFQGPGAELPPWGSALRAFAGRHPVVGDALLTALLALLATAPMHLVFGHRPQLLWFQLALLLPLVWRRRAPLVVFAAISAVAFAQWLYAGQALPGDVALLVALYTVAARCSRRRTLAASGVIALGNLLAVVRWAGPERGVKTFVALCGLALAAGMIGANMRNRRAYLAALEDRAARLERERDQRAQLAVAGERARIAREMHDIVTHSLSVMVALADGAAFAATRAPEKAAAAMEQVSGTGRQALTDMRRFLGVLRADEPDALRHPQPGIGQLDGLAAQVRAVGLPVRLRVDGDVASVPAAAQLTVYRIVQEALTNTLKHATDATRASVRVSCPGDRVEVDVRDDGHPVPSSGEGGHGIHGMRDRVAAYGGQVEAGPLPGGGWRVAACLKLGDPEPVNTPATEGEL
jgi:signal transduction histidine kinase